MEEFENVRTIGEIPVLPVPEGVIVIVPVYKLLGVTVKLADALFTFPEEGPLKVKEVATGALGMTEFEETEETELPTELVALTVKV